MNHAPWLPVSIGEKYGHWFPYSTGI